MATTATSSTTAVKAASTSSTSAAVEATATAGGCVASASTTAGRAVVIGASEASASGVRLKGAVAAAKWGDYGVGSVALGDLSGEHEALGFVVEGEGGCVIL